MSEDIKRILDDLAKLEREFLDDPDYPRRADIVVNASYAIERMLVALEDNKGRGK